MGSKGEEDIHLAARNGDLVTLEIIVGSNPTSLNSRDKHSRTPLHLAAWAGHAHVVTSLCKHKADVGAAAMDDMAAIHFAAQKGHLEVVKALVSAGASIRGANRKGMTPLHYAVQGSHVELIKYLLKKGVTLSAKTKAGKTPLDLATKEEIRSLLLEHENGKKTENESSEDKGVDADKDGESKMALEGNEENAKRKGDEDGGEENAVKAKKSKVALNHLIASDDTQEDEDE